MTQCTQIVQETTNNVVAFTFEEPDNGGAEILSYLIMERHL